VQTVVSRGGRPDLAGNSLRLAHQPTLLIVGEKDQQVIELNRKAITEMRGPSRLEIVPGATHLFEEPGALQHVARLATDWFLEHLRPLPNRDDQSWGEPGDDHWLDPSLVDGFLHGRLDEQGQATLADQVVRILPFHSTLPNPTALALDQMTRKLGGRRFLFEWLDRFPGRPRQCARIYPLIGLLDRISAEPAVVDALQTVRAEDPDPAGLSDYLAPDTDDATLAGLAFQIEALLGEDDDLSNAIDVALAATDLLSEVATRLLRTGADVGDLLASIRQLRAGIQAVKPQTVRRSRPGSPR
jgi:hypothetical protein